jgi:hypothetical protein
MWLHPASAGVHYFWVFDPSRDASSGQCGERGLISYCPAIVRRCDMTSQEKIIITVVPDLRQFSLDQLADLGGSPLAHSIALYRERLKENGVPLSSFNARI